MRRQFLPCLARIFRAELLAGVALALAICAWPAAAVAQHHDHHGGHHHGGDACRSGPGWGFIGAQPGFYGSGLGYFGGGWDCYGSGWGVYGGGFRGGYVLGNGPLIVGGGPVWGYGGYWGAPYLAYPPPLVMRSSALYGLGPVLDVMGVQPVVSDPGLGGGLAPAPPDEEPAGPAPSNAAAVARAERYVQLGDEHFRAQRFAEANSRYKKAAAAAPDLAEAWFRQGFAHAALQRFDLAAKAFKRGLAIAPDWAASGFRLEDLYAENRLAQQAAIERIAAAAIKQPRAGDLMFLVGVHLYFSGRPDRAEAFFRKADALRTDDGTYLSGFFDAIRQAGAEVAGREL